MTSPSGEAENPVVAAQRAWESAFNTYGPDHQSSITALVVLANARQQAGELLTAIDTLTAARDGYARTLGPEHPNTLDLAWRLTHWRYLAGDGAAAQTLRDLIPVLIQVLGEEHGDTVWARVILATMEDAGGDPGQRLVQWVQLCGLSTRVFGVRHEITLTAAYGAALARRELGDPFGASTDALVVYTYRARLLGGHHPETLAARLSHVMWHAESQESTESPLPALDELVPAMEVVLGHDHPNTLLARYFRAQWTPDEGSSDVDRLSEWEVLAEDLAHGRGEYDQLTVAARERRAQARQEWQAYLREFREIACDLYVDAEAEDLDVEMPDGRAWGDPGNLDDGALAKVNDDADEQESERDLVMQQVVAAKKALSASIRATGYESPEVLHWRYHLLWLFWEARELDAAAPRADRLLDDCVRLLGEDHPLTQASRELAAYAKTRTWVGVIPYWRGDLDLDHSG